MTLKGRYILNHNNEVQIRHMVFTYDELRCMFLDRRTTVVKLSHELGINHNQMYFVLKKAGAATGKNSVLSPARLRVLRFIIRYQRRHKISPTLSEIAEGLEMRVGNVHHHLTRLKESGYLTWTTKHRSIRLLNPVDHLVPKRNFGKEVRKYYLERR